MSLYKVPSLPRLPALPSFSGRAEAPDLNLPSPYKAQTDEFGLSIAIYGKASRLGRRYIAQCLQTLNKPKTVSPTVLFGVSAGTIPELVVFGFLIDSGYRYGGGGAHSFNWLSYEIGAGNVQAGTQLDFSVRNDGTRRIGVDVDSVFHTVLNPYAPGAKLEQDRRRRIKLLTTGGLQNVISVNRGPQHVLENGPDELVRQDLVRILYA